MNQHDTTVNDGFAFELRSCLLMHTFNMDEAIKLSDKLHKHECSGGSLSTTVETLWERLTAKIEAARAQEPLKG